MIKHGTAPYLECSTMGDKRLSAFCAVVDGSPIEVQYQAAKVFEDGSTGHGWKVVKGKKAVNQLEVADLYVSLWRKYIAEHSELQTVLMNATGLSDFFGQSGHVCQASVLWLIRNDLLVARSQCTS